MSRRSSSRSTGSARPWRSGRPSSSARRINRAYGHAKDGALGFLNDYFKRSNPFLREAEGTVAVQVQSVLRLSASSWQVQWRETQIAQGGRILSETAWQAVLGVELTPPETTDVLLVNPLGLYVTEINWTQSL